MEHVTVDDWVNFQVAGGKRLVCRVRQVRNYSSFDVMVQDLGIGALLPDFDGDFSNDPIDFEDEGSEEKGI